MGIILENTTIETKIGVLEIKIEQEIIETVEQYGIKTERRTK